MLGGNRFSPWAAFRNMQRFDPRKRPEARSCIAVPTSGESNHPPDLFFHEAFIPQLRDRRASRRGVEGLPRQGDELMRVLFKREDECDKESVLNESVLNVLPTHNAMLCT
jgi:hypothetical protein